MTVTARCLQLDQDNKYMLQVASFTRAVLRTLSQCHAHRILHRDIKPGNFMLLNDSDRAPLKAIGTLVYVCSDLLHAAKAAACLPGASEHKPSSVRSECLQTLVWQCSMSHQACPVQTWG